MLLACACRLLSSRCFFQVEGIRHFEEGHLGFSFQAAVPAFAARHRGITARWIA